MTRLQSDDPSTIPVGPRLVRSRQKDAIWRRGFTVGEWRVEPLLNRIVSADEERSLDPKLIDLLVFFASRQKQVLTRDELLSGVWHDVLVTENTLSQAVSRLRKALGEDRTRPRYIETISKTGYRLVADVQQPAHSVPPRSVPARPDG